jgi:WD40 repeat protein
MNTKRYLRSSCKIAKLPGKPKPEQAGTELQHWSDDPKVANTRTSLIESPPRLRPTSSISSKMSMLIPITTPLREFRGHEKRVMVVAMFPDKRRMVTGSEDKTLHLWDLKTGVVLRKMKGHPNCQVWALAVSRDGQLIASGDTRGMLMVWHGETGELLTQPIKAHSSCIISTDFSPDGTVLVTGAWDNMTKLWNTKTWQQQGNSIQCGSYVRCVRYSPSGELLAIATHDDIQVYNVTGARKVASFKGHTSLNWSLAWTPDGTRLLTGGDNADPTIREWDTTTWQQVGDPWTGHSNFISAIAVNAAGTLVTSASDDHHVRLWRLSDRQTVAIFEHLSSVNCATFSVNGKHILSGGDDNIISECAVPQCFHSKARFRP